MTVHACMQTWITECSIARVRTLSPLNWRESAMVTKIVQKERMNASFSAKVSVLYNVLTLSNA